MTIRDIAKMAGVSPATVSIVLNGKPGVSEERREAIQKVIEETGYQVTERKKPTNKIVLALSYLNSGILVEENQGFISMIMDAMQAELKKKNVTLMQMTVNGGADELLAQADLPGITGICVIASEMPREQYDVLQKMKCPFIVLDNLMPGYPYPCVGINNEENVHTALKYCADSGIKQIGYLKSSLKAENFTARAEAFDRYTKELGLETDQSQIFELTPTLRGAHHDMRLLLEAGASVPECLFADNDMIALGAMTCLKEHGYRIPQDVSIIGFDNIPYSGVSSPTLATINVQRETIGRMAAHLILEEMREQQQIPVKMAVTGQLKPRKSVKQTRQKNK
ncbi:MAG: LacI family DNA-binding transcriptional regulator [Chordicoccus sp.]|jgi:LacI family transcriptional regulator